MDKLISKFNASLVIDVSDIGTDFLEIGIDSFLDNEIVKEIPIIKSIVSTGKIIYSVKERYLLKNTAIFLKELNSGNIDLEKLKKHKKELEKNPKKAEKELGRVLLILEQTIENEKIVIQARLYKGLINQKITWDEFVEFSDITSRLFMSDIKLLEFMWKRNYNEYKENYDDRFRVERIYALGIIGNVPFTAKEVKCLYGKILNQLGNKYCDIIFSK